MVIRGVQYRQDGAALRAEMQAWWIRPQALAAAKRRFIHFGYNTFLILCGEWVMRRWIRCLALLLLFAAGASNAGLHRVEMSGFVSRIFDPTSAASSVIRAFDAVDYAFTFDDAFSGSGSGLVNDPDALRSFEGSAGGFEFGGGGGVVTIANDVFMAPVFGILSDFIGIAHWSSSLNSAVARSAREDVTRSNNAILGYALWDINARLTASSSLLDGLDLTASTFTGLAGRSSLSLTLNFVSVDPLDDGIIIVSALVRPTSVSPVPAPPTAWLIGLGMVAGFAQTRLGRKCRGA